MVEDAYQLDTAGRTLLLRRGQQVRIGRHPDNDLVVEDETVSRHHARLDWSACARPVIVDLGSANGTFLDGERIFGRGTLEEERCALGVGNTLIVMELKQPALIASDKEPLLCRLIGERGPDLDGDLAGPAALHALLLELAQARRTATLWVEHVGQNVLSRVTLAAGVVVEAWGPGSRGEPALRALLLYPGATRYMVRAEVEPCEKPLSLRVVDAVAAARRAARNAA